MLYIYYDFYLIFLTGILELIFSICSTRKNKGVKKTNIRKHEVTKKDTRSSYQNFLILRKESW